MITMFLSDRKSTFILTKIFISFVIARIKNLKFNFYMFDR